MDNSNIDKTSLLDIDHKVETLKKQLLQVGDEISMEDDIKYYNEFVAAGMEMYFRPSYGCLMFFNTPLTRFLFENIEKMRLLQSQKIYKEVTKNINSSIIKYIIEPYIDNSICPGKWGEDPFLNSEFRTKKEYMKYVFTPFVNSK